MYISKENRVENRDELLDFIRHNSFGMLVGIVDQKPFATHLPFAVVEREGRVMLQAHLARANSHGKALLDAEALVVFHGPHAYISPSHYNSRQSVPTWNYVAVHCYGIVRILDDALPVLQATMRLYEPEYEAQWDSLPELYQSRMKSGIIAFEVDVHTLEGNYKLSQNKTDDEKERIITTLLSSDRTEIQEIGAYMKRVKVQTNQPTN